MTSLSKEKSKEKPKYHLLPWDALEETAKVIAMGAEKHGERDWEKGIPYSEIVSALMRHLKLFFQDGKDYDIESGMFHTTHIVCNALFLLAYQLREIKGIDDRPSGGVDAWEIDEAFKQLKKDEQSEKQGGQRGAGLEEFKAFMADDDETRAKAPETIGDIMDREPKDLTDYRGVYEAFKQLKVEAKELGVTEEVLVAQLMESAGKDVKDNPTDDEVRCIQGRD